MIATEKFVKLSVLADEWSKTVTELLRWVSNGDMEALFGYKGYIKTQFGRELEYSGWAKVDTKDITLLQSLTDVTLKHFYIHSKNGSLEKVEPLKRYLMYNRIEGFIHDENFKISIDNLVVMSSEVERMELKYPELTREQPRQPVGDKTKDKKSGPDPRVTRTDLYIIGGLLEIILGKDASQEKLPFETQSLLIDTLLLNLKDFPGISKRTLEARFSDANTAIRKSK